jgi:hypothetical protein
VLSGASRAGVGGLSEVEQVQAFGFVELECAGDRLQDSVGYAGKIAFSNWV